MEKLPEAESSYGPAYEWDSTNHFMKWTFAVASKMLNIGYRNPLKFSDLMRLPKDLRTMQHVHSLMKAYPTAKPFYMYTRLMIALFSFVKFRIVVIFFLGIMKGALRIGSIVLLKYFLNSLTDSNGGEPFMWVGIMAALNLVTFVVHGILYYATMKVGWIWKMAVTGFLYDKLFELKSSQLFAGVNGSLGTGKLVNLISNDVARLEEYSVFSPYVIISLLEGVGVLAILAIFLNVPAAFAGVGTSILFIPFQIYLGGVFARYRSKTAAATDMRVRFISEVIEGISSVKCFGWEIPFISKIASIRAVELDNIIRSQYIRAMNMALYCFGPSVANFATFAVYWRSGGELNIPIVFFGISMLLSLRETFGRSLSRSIECTSEAISACSRIEKFLAIFEEDKNSNNNSSTSIGNNPTAANTAIIVHKPRCAVDVNNVSFSYSREGASQGFSLKGVNLQVRRGELLMVVGPVGAGKSTLLNSLLGELTSFTPTDGTTAEALVKGGFIDSSLSVAYCSQKPWIVAASVKSNIVLAGRSNQPDNTEGEVLFDEDEETDIIKPDQFKCPPHVNQVLYELALSKSRIAEDLQQWEHGDQTEIGERGISVSGGQKARLALARAIYADSDVYILDDVLSAVDAHVGRSIFFDGIIDSLKKRDKAVVLATHQVQYLPFADKIVVFDSEGQQVFFGSYSELVENAESFQFIGVCQSNASSTLTADDVEQTMEAHDAETGAVMQTAAETQADNVRDAEVADSVDAANANDYKEAAVSTGDATRESLLLTSGKTVAFLQGSKTATIAEESDATAATAAVAPNLSSKPQLQGVQEEKSQVGKVSANLWTTYFRNGGLCKGFYAFSMAILSQGALMMADYWLKWWAVGRFGSQDNIRYIWLYAILTVLCVLFSVLRAFSWFSFTINASRKLHELALWSLFHTPLGFFVANPTGRVLNRFSRDQNLVDETLPYTLYDCLENGFLFLLASLCLVCVSLPWLIILVPFVLYGFNAIRLRYTACSREIRRIESTLRSPIYSDFSATIEGLVTLRAYRLRQRATKSFIVEIDCDSRAWFNFLMVSRWLSFRMDFLSLLLILALCVLGAALRHTIDVGLLGFALTYSFAITTLLQWTVRQLAESENMMTSVERITEYATLPAEEGYHITYETYKSDTGLHNHYAASAHNNSSSHHDNAVAQNSRATELHSIALKKYKSERLSMVESNEDGVELAGMKGSIGKLQLSDLTVTYHKDMEPVLRNISVSIPAGAKVGVCGRTGSGKSSTLLALLRLNVIQSGDIQLDNRSILNAMSLEEARAQFSSIPQDPHLFSGTVRFNVDPFHEYSDDQIWSALADACIKPYIQSQNGLDMMVDEGGKNFSVGQRQLISMSRAILRRAPVVLMDEVTASIDYETDRNIQETIRKSEALRNSTIITIAHRLRTIADSDYIMVINAGSLVEFASPLQLLGNPESIFRSLAVQSNEMEEIVKLATEAAKRTY